MDPQPDLQRRTQALGRALMAAAGLVVLAAVAFGVWVRVVHG